MEINKLTNLAYSIELHKNDKKFNAIQYNYNIPNNMNKRLSNYFERNKMNIQQFVPYDKDQAKVRLIISYFLNNNQIPKNCTDKEYNVLVTSLYEYKNELAIFAKKILQKPSLFTPKEILKMFNKKEIPFYIFYYSIVFGNFELNQLDSLLVKNRLLQIHKMMMFFKIFNDDYFKEHIKQIHNYIKLNGGNE